MPYTLLRAILLLSCLWVGGMACAQPPSWIEEADITVLDTEEENGYPAWMEDSVPTHRENYLASEITVLQPDTAIWKKATQGMVFEQDIRPDRTQNDKKNNLRYGPELLKILTLLLFGGLLFYLIWRMVGLRTPANRKLNYTPEVSEIDLDELSANLDKEELSPYLMAAEEAGAWRMALRLRFLMALQRLVQQDAVQWQPDKTNRAYLHELASTGQQQSFGRLMEVFEQVWYGPPEQPFTEADYRALVPNFERFAPVTHPSAHA